ncbi:MAG TPA: hypothetical protein VH325_12410 [Bryobacteraceae bacterium]|nr:hypothetical protein [Bryobacteraceae bacterium]
MNRSAAFVLATILCISLGADAQSNISCPSGPYTSCTDPYPATYLSGSWIETDGASEWTLTANNGKPGGSGTVIGTVLVFPPASINPGNCPVISYNASGSFNPSNVTPGTEGSTAFRWVATVPTPYVTCGGYTPSDKPDFHWRDH